MATLGPQFVQTAMPIYGDKSTNILKMRDTYHNRLRAAYHLNRDTPAVELAIKGASTVSLPTPHPLGITSQIHALNSPAPSGTLSSGVVTSGRRENYSHGGKGQMVMGLPSRGLEKFQELDYHGNVRDEDSKKGFNSDDYHHYGPQMSTMHQEIWNQHGQTKMLPSKTILHTLQPSYDTGSHARITGPLDKGEPAAHVLINQGIPELVDGHHRTAEWRGRGNTEFPARVLNLDQLGPEVRKQFARANNPRRNDEIV